jgi:hypothetical protein
MAKTKISGEKASQRPKPKRGGIKRGDGFIYLFNVGQPDIDFP